MSSIRLTLICAAVIGLACCGGSHEAKKTGGPAAPLVAVKTVAVERATVADEYEATGTVRAKNVAMVAPQIMGMIREITVRAGDRVNAGQLLAVIDAREIEARVEQARAMVREAQQTQPEVAEAIRAARAQHELAATTLKRMQDLLAKQSISQQELDEVSAREKAARAMLEGAQAKQAQVKEKIAQAEEGLKAAEVMRGYARLTSPVAGTVTERKADPGSMAVPGMPILIIEQGGAFRLEAAIEETRLAQVKVGTSAKVKLDALAEEIAARVVEVVPSVDPMSRTFTAKLELPSRTEIRTGLFGRARFTVGERTALRVPPSALSAQGQVDTVLVAGEGVAKRRMVTVGARGRDAVEVLSGLEAGEKVIAPVPAALADGGKIEVRP